MNPVSQIRHAKDFANEKFGFSDSEIATIMSSIDHRGDRWMQFFLFYHAIIAFVLAFFYDTWVLSLSVSALAIAMFLVSVKILPGQFVTRCIAGISLQCFVALHIYQMHGMAEMHFFYFTAFTMMLIYQDWICLWPGALLIICQHILFAILHNAGAPLFFFQESYVGFTKLFFHFGIALTHVAVCGFWSLIKKRQTLLFERQNTDLRTATLKAEEAAETKSAFLAMMSHEIRTPMNAVMGMTQLLLDTTLTHQQRSFAESARKGADGLLSVINDVLDFSKIEASKIKIDLSPFNLRVLLREVVHLLHQGAEDKGLRLDLVYPAEMQETFSGDPNRIRQIALNLVSNAIKYTDQGSVELRILITSANGENLVTLSVIDTGIGIVKELQPLLFQEFSQLDRRMTRKQGGTGLGLAITKKLVELMDGEIGYKSIPGEGTTFWVKLPLNPCSPAAAPQELQSKQSLSNFKVSILVAEDNTVNQIVVEAFLHKLGCTVAIAHDGQMAIEMWGSGTYDMIFMDCQMPLLDGYEATRKIRSLETTGHHAPIVAMTAHAMAGDREICLACGMDDYITKPLKIEDLARTLERWSPALSKSSPDQPQRITTGSE